MIYQGNQTSSVCYREGDTVRVTAHYVAGCGRVRWLEQGQSIPACECDDEGCAAFRRITPAA